MKVFVRHKMAGSARRDQGALRRQRGAPRVRGQRYGNEQAHKAIPSDGPSKRGLAGFAVYCLV